MKIADVKVTIWERKNIPPTRYTLQVKSSGTCTAHMALVRIICDDGTEGHAFLGSALSLWGVERTNCWPVQTFFSRARSPRS